jgi:hypothetical protein
MNRRGFLQGVFGGVTAGGLIVAASPADIAAFSSPLVKDAPLLLDVPAEASTHIGGHLYNERGQCVAIIRRIDRFSNPVDVTTAFDGHTIYLPGVPRFDIYAQGIGELRWDGSQRMPELVGVQR